MYTCPNLMDMLSQEHFILTYGAVVINNWLEFGQEHCHHTKQALIHHIRMNTVETNKHKFIIDKHHAVLGCLISQLHIS